MTRRLIITENITIDGVIENDGTWFDPTDDSEQGRELAEITRQHAAASDGFLVGRTTFEEMREFWPRQVDDTTGVTDHLYRVEKYVVSRDLEDPGWDGTTVLRGGDGLAPAVPLPCGSRDRPSTVPGEHRAARSLPGREPGVLRRSRPAAVRTVGRRLPWQNRTMATDSIDQVTVAYGARADDYIHAVGRIEHASAADLKLVRDWALERTSPLLDVGCGPGQWTNWLRRQGAQITGIDPVPEFIERARASYPDADYRSGRADCLGADADSLGGVLAWFSLIHSDAHGVVSALAEFAHCVRPGGGLLLGFFAGETTTNLSTTP